MGAPYKVRVPTTQRPAEEVPTTAAESAACTPQHLRQLARDKSDKVSSAARQKLRLRGLADVQSQ